MDPSLLSPPLSASSVGSRRNKFFTPLSSHGMPKAPPLSPNGSIRSDRFGNPSTRLTSPPMSPMSFMSPMSAKSFGTFIESAPSTPSFSPQPTPSQWGGSALVLLTPVASTTASSPPEPEWQMMPPAHTRSRSLPGERPSGLGLEIASETSLSSHPVRTHSEEPKKETFPPLVDDTPADPEGERKSEEEEPSDTLGRLAVKMKSMLRRTTLGDKDKKTKKRRRTREEFEYIEDIHWTEM